MTRKPSVLLLLIALLGAGLHPVTHISDAAGSSAHSSISSRSHSDSDSSGGTSFGNSHTCLACQTLHHLQVNAPDPVTLTLADENAVPDWRILPVHADALCAIPAGRAPPLV